MYDKTYANYLRFPVYLCEYRVSTLLTSYRKRLFFIFRLQKESLFDRFVGGDGF